MWMVALKCMREISVWMETLKDLARHDRAVDDDWRKRHIPEVLAEVFINKFLSHNVNYVNFYKINTK